MKTLALFFSILVLLLFTFSCSKDVDQPVIIKGQLLNKFTQTPISESAIYLREPRSGPDPYFAWDTTDFNGYFSLKVKEVENTFWSSLYFDSFHPDYQHWNWWVNDTEEPEWDYEIVNGNELDNYSIEFYPMTYFEISFVDVDSLPNPSDPGGIVVSNWYYYHLVLGAPSTGWGDDEDDYWKLDSSRYLPLDSLSKEYSGYCYEKNVLDFHLYEGTLFNPEEGQLIKSVECIPGETTSIVIEY